MGTLRNKSSEVIWYKALGPRCKLGSARNIYCGATPEESDNAFEIVPSFL